MSTADDNGYGDTQGEFQSGERLRKALCPGAQTAIKLGSMAVKLTILVWLLGACAYSQVAERRLKELYSRTSDNAFIIGPSVRAYATFDQHHKACAFTVHGAISEAQVLHYFNLLVPENTRGTKQAAEPFWCVNVCEHVIVYQNVTLTTAVTANQTSDPAAIITFKRSECKAAVAETKKTALQIKNR